MIPQCYGCIDGSHIPIKKPVHQGEDYFNRKGFYSVVLHAAVDHRGYVFSAFTGLPGKTNDSRCLRWSTLPALMDRVKQTTTPRSVVVGTNAMAAIPYFILGDSAYANTDSVVTTFEMFRVNASADVKRLNRQLSGIRYIVEKVFGNSSIIQYSHI
jgi:hypothetical protein